MKSLAIDLGATSGRVMLGELQEGVLSLEELHRFANTPVQLPTGLYWCADHVEWNQHAAFVC